jgi:hypothetical protein
MELMRSTWTDERLDDLNVRVDRGFDRVDRRFEQVDRRFEQVDQRFERMEQKFDRVDERFQSVDQRFVQMGVALEGINKRMTQGLIAITATMMAGFAAMIALIATQL